MENNSVDFTFAKYKRSSLYLKRSPGAPIPEGYVWNCPCGSENPLTSNAEQYCRQCGTRLRLQEQDPSSVPPHQQDGVNRYTLVRVSHFEIRPSGA